MYNMIEVMCMIFKKLAQKLNTRKVKNIAGMINPVDVDFDAPKNEFLNTLTKDVLKMYEKKCDIKNFSSLVLANPENLSHNEMVEKLFDSGVIDPFEDDKLQHLADNAKLLRDLGLSD